MVSLTSLPYWQGIVLNADLTCFLYNIKPISLHWYELQFKHYNICLQVPHDLAPLLENNLNFNHFPFTHLQVCLSDFHIFFLYSHCFFCLLMFIVNSNTACFIKPLLTFLAFPQRTFFQCLSCLYSSLSNDSTYFFINLLLSVGLNAHLIYFLRVWQSPRHLVGTQHIFIGKTNT